MNTQDLVAITGRIQTHSGSYMWTSRTENFAYCLYHCVHLPPLYMILRGSQPNTCRTCCAATVPLPVSAAGRLCQATRTMNNKASGPLSRLSPSQKDSTHTLNLTGIFIV